MTKNRKSRLESISKESGIPVDFLVRACKGNRMQMQLERWLDKNLSSLITFAPNGSEYIVAAIETSKDDKEILNIGIYYTRNIENVNRIREEKRASVYKYIPEEKALG